MSEELATEAAWSWNTDRMSFLDDPELINATIVELDGALPGTHKTYDSQKISSEIVHMLLAELERQDGIHVETVLATLGALAGFAVQMSLRETLVKPGKMSEDRAFIIAESESGDSFYLGDLVNEGLFGGKQGRQSVFALVGDGAQMVGAKQLPDINEIALYVVSTLGTDAFGVPRVPQEHMPRAQPTELLNRFWNPVRNWMVLNVQEPSHWPMVLGLATQNFIIVSKALVDPALSAHLVMEIATAMAKIDPAKIHYAYFQSC